MDIIVIQPNQAKIDFSNWKEAQGSSLSKESHDLLNQGKILCVDKRPCKVKFFIKEGNSLMSLCSVPVCSIENEIKKVFGLATIEANCLQEV